MNENTDPTCEASDWTPAEGVHNRVAARGNGPDHLRDDRPDHHELAARYRSGGPRRRRRDYGKPHTPETHAARQALARERTAERDRRTAQPALPPRTR